MNGRRREKEGGRLETGDRKQETEERSVLFWLLASGCWLLFSGCFQTAQIYTAQSNYYQGRYDDAVQRLESSEIPARDALLAFLEKGMALQAAGRYAESAGAWRLASDLMDKQDIFHAGEEALSLVFDQNVMSYQPTPYERPFLHALLCMDYLMLGDVPSARVEALQALKNLEAREAIVGPMAFVRYVAARAFEASGDLNDAYIEYRKIDAAGGTDVLPDLLRLSDSLGFADDQAKYTARAEELDTADRPVPGPTMPVFVFLGKSPRKVYSEVVLADQYKVLLPVFQTQENPIRRVVAFTSGGERFPSAALTSVEKLASNYSGRLFAKELLKEVLRKKVQEKIVEKVGDKLGSTTESLLKAVFFFAKEEDLRTWSSLPAQIQLLRASADSAFRISYTDTAQKSLGDTEIIPAPDSATPPIRLLRAW